MHRSAFSEKGGAMITLSMLLIFCPLMFMAGLVDAIGGGGGLIALPACLLAGLPIHSAIGTNKISSTFGNVLTTAEYFKGKLINLKLGVPTILAAAAGSYLGSTFSIMTSEAVLQKILLPVLVVVAIIVFNRNLFHDNGQELVVSAGVCIKASVVSLIVGFYDGFYGPGGGTFMIIGLTMFAGLSMRQAGGQSKLINMATNFSSVAVYILHGEVVWLLGAIGAVFNMLGSYIGARLAIRQGEKVIRPMILLVIAALFIKIVTGN